MARSEDPKRKGHVIQRVQITNPKQPVSIQFDVCGAVEHGESPHLYAVSKTALREASHHSPCGGLSWEQECRFNDKYMCEITKT
jgi:hypothetical protein